MFRSNNNSRLYSFKKTFALPDSSKQHVTNSLYVADPSYSSEQIVRHCLWKLLSETGFIHSGQLSQMESITLSKALKKKSASGNGSLNGDSEFEVTVLNNAIDKIVCQMKIMQGENQRYHTVAEENRRLKKGLNHPERVSDQDCGSSISLKMSRSINDIGLPKRAARILQSMGINTLERLRNCSLSRLQNQERIGVKTIHDIEVILSKYSTHASPDP